MEKSNKIKQIQERMERLKKMEDNNKYVFGIEPFYGGKKHKKNRVKSLKKQKKTLRNKGGYKGKLNKNKRKTRKNK